MFVRQIIYQPRSIEDALLSFTVEWETRGWSVVASSVIATYQQNFIQPFDDVLVEATLVK